jgi:hypothetical protein
MGNRHKTPILDAIGENLSRAGGCSCVDVDVGVDVDVNVGMVSVKEYMCVLDWVVEEGRGWERIVVEWKGVDGRGWEWQIGRLRE